MFDADRVLVRAHAMIRTVAITYHLVNVTVSINDIVRRNLTAIRFLKFCQAAGKRTFSAMHNNFVDACAVAARTIWTLDKLFNHWVCVRVTTSMTSTAHSERGFYSYG